MSSRKAAAPLTTPANVRKAVATDPTNALSIIEEANGRACAHGWHRIRYPTQYYPVEVEKVVSVTEYVDRAVSFPVPDPAVEAQLQCAQEELDQLRLRAKQGNAPAEGEATRDRLSYRAINAKLKQKLSKKDEQISDLQAALLRNFALVKEVSDESSPELARVRKEQMQLLRSKVSHLQEILRRKEEYIQEVTQALLDSSTATLRTQRETQEVLRMERLASAARWNEAKELEKRAESLENELMVIPALRSELTESTALIEELKQHIADKDDVIDALEEQFRQTTADEAADLTRDQVLVRMTQLRFKIGLKNAAALRAKAEIFNLTEKTKALEAALSRASALEEGRVSEVSRLSVANEALEVQLAGLRRDLLAASAPVRPLVMPPPIYDDALRLMEAPTAPRTRPMTEQDIVAAFGLFDSTVQGELPAWDMPLFFRVLGFTSDDPTVSRLSAQYRDDSGTLSLEEFRDVILSVQKEYEAMKLSTESLLGQWQEASRRRIEAGKRRARKKRDKTRDAAAGGGEEDADVDSDSIGSDTSGHRTDAGGDKLHRAIGSVSLRAVPMTSADVDDSFSLFDYDRSGEICREKAATLIHCLGLVRTTSDLDALCILVSREYSHTLSAHEWSDLIAYCQGARPNFVRNTTLEHKPPKAMIYPPRYPRAHRAHPLSERELRTAFRLFDVDASGLLPGYQVPTYLECLGLVPSGPELTALLVTQYKADLTQRVHHDYFCKLIMFVQSHLEFFDPPAEPPPVKRPGAASALDARKQQPIMAPAYQHAPAPHAPHHSAAAAAATSGKVLPSSLQGSPTLWSSKPQGQPPPKPSPKPPQSGSTRVPPSRCSTVGYSPRTRRPGEYPPWMIPTKLPLQVGDAGGETPPHRSQHPLPAAPPPQPPGSKFEAKQEKQMANAFARRLAAKEEASHQSDSPLGSPVSNSPRVLPGSAEPAAAAAPGQTEILTAFHAFSKLFASPHTAVSRAPSLALSQYGALLAVRALGYCGVTHRFLEQIWPREAKEQAAYLRGDGLAVNENEFVGLVRNLARFGAHRAAEKAGLPKTVNRHLSGGALRDRDVQWVFSLVDCDGKEFVSGRELRTMLTLMGFALHDEPEIQNVLLAYDAQRPSRTAREHNIYELQDCKHVIAKLTAKPAREIREDPIAPPSWM
ncbi:hypothetical protein DIPPA_32802 [Diplonema papillatum]|nr:hypothetical protein DIPPA_32802 [Diplonema papillatum]